MSENQVHQIISTSQDPSLFQIAKIARLTLRSPALLLDVLDGLRSSEPRMSMYCAEVVEKVSRVKLTLLTGYETEILTNFAMSTFAEVRGPLALVIPRLTLSEAMRRNAVSLMFDYLNKDDSTILRERLFVALTEVSREDLSVKERVVPLLTTRLLSEESGDRYRAKDLLAKLTGKLI